MKTDKFDEAFRRKVESFHPPFSENEIDKIQGYVTQRIPLSFWQRFGHTISYSIGTLTIISLLTTTIFQTNENKSLLNKVSELNKKIAQSQLQKADNQTSLPVVIEKIDTIYVVKHIKKSIIADKPEEDFTQKNDVPNSSNNSLVATTTLPQNALVLSANESINTAQTLEHDKREVINNTVSTNNFIEQSTETQNLNNSKNKTNINDNISTNKTIKPDSRTNSIQNQHLKNEQGSNSELQSIITTNDNTPNLNTEKQQSLKLADLKSREFNSLVLSSVVHFSNRPLKTPHWIKQTTKQAGIKLPQIGLPTLKYRVGIGSLIDNEQIGVSIMGEVLFSKRWSVTTGLSMGILGFEHFGDEDDFKRKTAKDFREQHGLDIAINTPISDIEAHQVLFRIPFVLNYRYSLRKGYTILFSTGTDFDINLRQFTSYYSNDFMKKNQQDDFSENIKVTPFNNWVLSTGIEKRWNRFSVQINPYTSYQFKSLSYRYTDWIFGIKMNGFYRLK